MKKVLLSLALATTYTFASSLNCDPNHDECKTDTVTAVEQTTLVEVVNNTNRLDLSNSKNTASVTAQVIFSGDVKMMNIPVGFNATENIGLEAGIPVISVSNFGTTKEDNTGIGDIYIGANYHFGSYDSDYGLNITTLRYKSTTGDETKGLGLGKDSYTLSHNFAKELGFARAQALLAYTVNDDTVLGNSLSAMLGASRPCLLSDKLRTNLKFTYFNIDEVDKSSYFISGFKKADVWLEFNSDKLVNGIPLGLGFKFPVVDEVTVSGGGTMNADKTVLFYLSAGSFF